MTPRADSRSGSAARSASGGPPSGDGSGPRIFGQLLARSSQQEVLRLEEGTAEFPIVLVVGSEEAQLSRSAAARLRDWLNEALR